MLRRSRALPRLVAVLLVAGGVLAPAAGASAADAPGLTGAGAAVQPQGAVNSSVVLFVCSAAAPGAVAVSVERCVYSSPSGSYSAPGASLPGPFMATGGTGLNFSDGRHEVCWTVRAQYANGGELRESGCAEQSL